MVVVGCRRPRRRDRTRHGTLLVGWVAAPRPLAPIGRSWPSQTPRCRPELVATNATTRPPCFAFVPPSRPWKTLESGGFFSLTPPEPWQIRAANKIGGWRCAPLFASLLAGFLRPHERACRASACSDAAAHRTGPVGRSFAPAA